MRTTVGRAVAAVLFVSMTAAAELTVTPQKTRQPQFPLKSERTVFSDEDIQRARRNIAAYSTAKAIAAGLQAKADYWLAWSDQDLREAIPTCDVPRAFDVCTAGCPICGKKIHEKGGTYPWIIDPKRPFKVECPICHTVFPDNDYQSFYRSGFRDRRFVEGKYADDGWGWVSPSGEKFWFVAHANHWTIYGRLVPGIEALAYTYLFTGDTRYAHKAAVLLGRIAEVYPSMDHEKQSRYGQLLAARGERYRGKIVNNIWETVLFAQAVLAYDAVWETIDGDRELQRATGRTGEQVRADIEANLIEDGIDAIFEAKIRGNFGMHQRALVCAALTRQFGNNKEWLDGLFTRTGVAGAETGLNYALYNLVYRDGVPYETAPGYNSLWVDKISDIGEALRKTGRDVFALPKMRRLYSGMLDIVNVRSFTPAVGDSGGVYGGLAAPLDALGTDYRAYKDPRAHAMLAKLNGVGKNSFRSVESLFFPVIDAVDRGFAPQSSRLLDGYGMAIINNPSDTISASLYYGYHGGHGHYDRLHFELFAHGQPIMPDLGYPDSMNAFVPGIFTWSKNTIAHNTVTVDASRQPENRPGVVRIFAEGPFARVVEVEAPGTYPQCSQYRRCLIMVDVDTERSFFVDFFNVSGGTRHDCSLHGPPGTFEAIGGTWKKQKQGTLAGEGVDIGTIYDDAALSVPGFKGGFTGYKGSGFQHLFNVQRRVEGAFVAQWTHEKDPELKLRIRALDEGGPGSETILADARVSPVSHPQILKYLIARRAATSLQSRFVHVIEPFKGMPFIETASAVRQDGGITTVVVGLVDGRQIMISDNPLRRRGAFQQEENVDTDSACAVVERGADSRFTRAFFADGTRLSVDGRSIEGTPVPAGEVIGVCPSKQEIRIRLDSSARFKTRSLVGRVVHFENALHRTAHPVLSASRTGNDLTLRTRDDLLVGRAHLIRVDTRAVVTDTAFQFPLIYAGTHLSDAEFRGYYAVLQMKDAGERSIDLANPLPAGHAMKAGDDAWLVDVAPGDRLIVPQIGTWERR